MLILTGPTASGKNTIGLKLASRFDRCAVVDFDLVRAMFVNPHQPPWAGDEGALQQKLGVELVCSLANGFYDAGWEVVILDVLTSETVCLYRQLLNDFNIKIIQLLPTFEEIRRRFYERGPCLTEKELEMVYQEQCSYKDFDLRIDNTNLSIEETVEMITAIL